MNHCELSLNQKGWLVEVFSEKGGVDKSCGHKASLYLTLGFWPHPPIGRLRLDFEFHLTHSIHGTNGIFAYIYHKNQPFIGKSTGKTYVLPATPREHSNHSMGS